jgi:hypothetical protein
MTFDPLLKVPKRIRRVTNNNFGTPRTIFDLCGRQFLVSASSLRFPRQLSQDFCQAYQ